MMVIVAIMSNTCIFQFVGIKAIKASKGNLLKLMMLLCIFTGTISMFIDSVTTILLMVPVTISVFRSIKLSPIPFIIAMVLASEVGGAATLIGDPPYIMIGSAAGIGTHLSYIWVQLLLRYLFRNDLKSSVNDRDGIMNENEYAYLEDINTLKKSPGVLIDIIILLAFYGILNVEPYLSHVINALT